MDAVNDLPDNMNGGRMPEVTDDQMGKTLPMPDEIKGLPETDLDM